MDTTEALTHFRSMHEADNVWSDNSKAEGTAEEWQGKFYTEEGKAQL